MNSLSSKKQFIAGAKCPKCHAMDALVFYRETDASANRVQEVPVRECVDCGFKERLLEEESEIKKGQADDALKIKIKRL